MSLETILDDPDFVKHNKDNIISIEKHFSKILKRLEEVDYEKKDLQKKMPEYVKTFYDNSERVTEGFGDLIKMEKNQVEKIFEKTLEKIKNLFEKSAEKLKKKLEKQEKKFNENVEQMKQKIEEVYFMKDIPGKYDLIDNFEKMDGKEALKYHKKLQKLCEEKDEFAYNSYFELIHREILKTSKNPPTYKLKETTQKKLEQLVDLLEDCVDKIAKEIKSTIKDSKVAKLTKISIEDCKRDISPNGLSGFFNFTEENQKLGFKLKKAIVTTHDQSISCIQNIDSQFLATAGRDGKICIWDLLTCDLVTQNSTLNDVVTCMSLAHRRKKSENVLLCAGSGSLDGSIIIWDLKAEKEKAKLKGHRGAVSCLDQLGLRRSIASGGHDGKILIWDLEEKKIVNQVQAHTSMVTSLRFIKSRKSIVSSGWDCQLKIWKISFNIDKKGEFVKNLEIDSVIKTGTPIINAINRQILGNFVVSVGMDNSIKVWNIDSQELEGEFGLKSTNAEICLVENKFKHGKADFVTLNTAIREEENYVGDGLLRHLDMKTDNYSMSSYFTQPKVQLVQDVDGGLMLAKVMTMSGEGSTVNLYDIV